MDTSRTVNQSGTDWTLLGLAAALRARRVGAVEVARAALERLEAVRTVIGGVAAVDPERTLESARVAERRLKEGEGGALEGVPFTVKDWIDVAGWPVAGSYGTDPGQAGRRPDEDATAVARLRAAGAVVLAITSAGVDSVYGPVRNPLNPALSPGGSSSGAAALTAAGVVTLGLGSDSGGSIRLPAAWCGLVGLKPSFGRVPLTGHFPRCGEFEDGRTVIGPLTRTVDDAAAVLALIAGSDGRDAGVQPVPLGDPDTVDVSALRIGISGRNEATADAMRPLLAAGAKQIDEPVPDLRDEALELTRRYWSREKLTGAECLQFLSDWDSFRTRLLTIVEPLDIILCPAVDHPAPEWREPTDTDFTWMLPWSLTGSPVVAVPVGAASVQVIGRRWQDHLAIAVARLIG
jgi:amidase